MIFIFHIHHRVKNILGNIASSFFKSIFLGEIFLGWCHLRVSENGANVRSIEKRMAWLGLAKVQVIALLKITPKQRFAKSI